HKCAPHYRTKLRLSCRRDSQASKYPGRETAERNWSKRRQACGRQRMQRPAPRALRCAAVTSVQTTSFGLMTFRQLKTDCGLLIDQASHPFNEFGNVLPSRKPRMRA